MPNYRRARAAGGTYFFTVVTYRRQNIFVDEFAINELRNAIKWVKQKHPFQIDACVVMPDHLHAVLAINLKYLECGCINSYVG